MKKISAFFVTIALFSFAADATLGAQYPKSAKAQRDERVGSVFGGEGGSSSDEGSGGLAIIGGKKKSSDSSDMVKGIGVNPYMWQASLDIISFMPVIISDPVGGVIATDWLEDQNGKGERHKVNVIIKSRELRAADLKVTVFKQVLRDHMWRDAKVHDSLAHDVEDKILTKARSLKLAQDH